MWNLPQPASSRIVKHSCFQDLHTHQGPHSQHLTFDSPSNDGASLSQMRTRGQRRIARARRTGCVRVWAATSAWTRPVTTASRSAAAAWVKGSYVVVSRPRWAADQRELAAELTSGCFIDLCVCLFVCCSQQHVPTTQSALRVKTRPTATSPIPSRRVYHTPGQWARGVCPSTVCVRRFRLSGEHNQSTAAVTERDCWWVSRSSSARNFGHTHARARARAHCIGSLPWVSIDRTAVLLIFAPTPFH